MHTIIIDGLIGAFVGLFAGLLSQYNTSWKIFSFLWSAPLALFIPLYISYNREKYVLEGFLKHSMLGISISMILIILTYFIIKINIKLALIINFILSFILIYSYFNYKLYNY